MPRYAWQGRGAHGQRLRGEAHADSFTALQQRLRARGIRLRQARRTSTLSGRWRGPRLGAHDALRFTQQLTTLLQAGLPLLQALHLLARGQTNARLRALIDELAQDIEAGQSFSQALRAHPLFDATYANLVAAGESAGQLDDMLQHLAQHLEKTLALQRTLRSAMVYPLAVMGVGGGVAVLLLGFVVPAFEGMFQNLGAELPALTRAVLEASRRLQTDGVSWLLGFAALVGLLHRAVRHPSVRLRWEGGCLRLPLWGALTCHAQTARWSRTLAMLLRAGIALQEALALSTEVLTHSHYRRASASVAQQLAQGHGLAQSLAQHPRLFDALWVQLCAVGEESGTLDGMLLRLAEHNEAWVETCVARLATLLEPAVMVVLGLVLGTLVLAMYWPIFQMGQVI